MMETIMDIKKLVYLTRISIPHWPECNTNDLSIRVTYRILPVKANPKKGRCYERRLLNTISRCSIE
jgi:hypothetical protein